MYKIQSKRACLRLSEQQLREIFKGFDKDGNNALSKDELKQAFEYLGALIPAYRAYRGVCRADANGDGKIELDTELDDLVKYAHKIGYTYK